MKETCKMKYLTKQELEKMSYKQRKEYYQKVKDHKFKNVKEGTPLVWYNHDYTKITILEYRYSGVNDWDGFKECVYSKGSSIAYLPTEVEIATKEEIDKYIELKRKQFDNVIKHLEGLKDLV